MKLVYALLYIYSLFFSKDTPNNGRSSSTAPTYRVLYYDWKINWNDLTGDIKSGVDMGFNVIILGFYLDNGPADAATTWMGMSDQKKQEALDYVHEAGGHILVSAGGATFDAASYMAKGVDSAATWCSAAAQWAKTNMLDGVDFDIEVPPGDSAPFADGSGIDWLVTCSNIAREELGDDGVITHAPQAPYFGTWAGPKMGYTEVYKRAPSINFFNIQYYNQGSVYDSYNQLFVQNKAFPETAIMEINKNGVPLEKLVVGKPVDSGDAGSGWVDPGTLSSWGDEAHMEFGWSAGYMGWMYSPGSTAVKVFGADLSQPFNQD